MENQDVSTFNHLFELLEKNFLGHFSPRRARGSLWARRAWRTRWARLAEKRRTKHCHASDLIWKLWCKFGKQENTPIILKIQFYWKTVRHTVHLRGLPGVVYACDTFQGSCQQVFWQSPSMIPVDPLSGCQKSAVETNTQTENIFPHELWGTCEY